jgi:hypothetical protein
MQVLHREKRTTPGAGWLRTPVVPSDPRMNQLRKDYYKPDEM